MNRQNGGVLKNADNHAMMKPDTVPINRADLKRIHDIALALVQATRPLLGLEPVPTGKQIRRERSQTP